MGKNNPLKPLSKRKVFYPWSQVALRTISILFFFERENDKNEIML